jgi:hypothetical protein
MPYSQGKARSDMTVEERIGAADRRKMDGNVLFQENKLEEAMQQYEMVTHSCFLFSFLFLIYENFFLLYMSILGLINCLLSWFLSGHSLYGR